MNHMTSMLEALRSQSMPVTRHRTRAAERRAATGRYAIVLATAGTAGIGWAGETNLPVRYQDIAKSKLARLVEVRGAPEQEPAFGHVAARVES